eukprot:COSAG06_NODE_854_length_11931_cov_55.985970_15_plen_151_part_00
MLLLPYYHTYGSTAGIWNERASDPDWIVRLRSAMDKAGHAHTVIVASDTNYQVCDGFVKNKTVSDAIGTCRHDTKDLKQFSLAVCHAGIIGAHYPITKPGVQMPPPPPSCYEMDKPLWTSEGWDLGQVNDWKGAINLGAQRPQHSAVLPS